jgi:hypothetical protein
MQYDMHYYGTYAMAAAAGIQQQDAEVIATAAQFVDDQNFARWVLANSREGILGIATAHHPLEAGIRTVFSHAEGDDSRLVWVPFHFLPGAEGKSFPEKMLCRKNSKVVNRMLDYYLSAEMLREHRSHALHLMGIAAHVYADTFSHYGFSGIRSDCNRIDNDSIRYDPSHSKKIIDYIQEKKDRFMSHFTEAPSLGHGAVATDPDRPYLKWSFKYEGGEMSHRDNPASYLQACQNLFLRFRQFAQVFYGQAVPALAEWEQLEAPVKTILALEASGDERVDCWLNAMQSGQLGNIPACRQYNQDEWSDEIDKLESSPDTTNFSKSHPYHFFVAADYHRNYVLKRLLPSPEFGLMAA